MVLDIAFPSWQIEPVPPSGIPSILKPTCVSRIIFAENQSEPEPTMKRLKVFFAVSLTVAFLPTFLSDAQQTNTLPNGAQYIGEMKDGKPKGQGRLISTNGIEYAGMFQNGTLNTQGTMTLPNGDKFVGEFRDGRLNGKGTAALIGSVSYVGEFKDGQFDGKGTSICRSKWKYVGEYRNGERNGKGTLTVFTIKDGTLQDGRQYVGDFKDGKKDGRGKMTYPDGKVEDGLWADGKFMGASTTP